MSKLNTKHAVTIVCAMILVGTEVFAIAIALGWALAGLFELGDTVSYALMSVFSLLGILLMLKLWRQATRVEPIWDDAARKEQFEERA